jgi:hypothetical protein
VATREHDRIVETQPEARQGERGPTVLALLDVSTGLAVLVLGIAWFVFFLQPIQLHAADFQLAASGG